MDEDFLDVTESSKKVWIIFIAVIVVLAVLGYFFIFKKYTFGIKTVKLEIGSTISTDVEDYLTRKVANPSEYKLDVSKVNTDEAGTFTYTVTYNGITKKGKVEVKDTKAPEFTLQELVVEEGNTDYFLGDILEKCEDISMPCLVSLKNEDDIKLFDQVGTHKIDIFVSDIYGNKVDAKGDIKVVEKGTYVDPKSQDLEVASNSRDDENFNGLIYEKLDKALRASGDEADDAMAEVSKIDLEAYVNVNYPGYKLVSSEIIELFNKSSYVVGYSIEIVITNGTLKTVYADKSKVPAAVSEPETDEKE